MSTKFRKQSFYWRKSSTVSRETLGRPLNYGADCGYGVKSLGAWKDSRDWMGTLRDNADELLRERGMTINALAVKLGFRSASTLYDKFNGTVEDLQTGLIQRMGEELGLSEPEVLRRLREGPQKETDVGREAGFHAKGEGGNHGALRHYDKADRAHVHAIWKQLDYITTFLQKEVAALGHLIEDEEGRRKT